MIGEHPKLRVRPRDGREKGTSGSNAGIRSKALPEIALPLSETERECAPAETRLEARSHNSPLRSAADLNSAGISPCGSLPAWGWGFRLLLGLSHSLIPIFFQDFVISPGDLFAEGWGLSHCPGMSLLELYQEIRMEFMRAVAREDLETGDRVNLPAGCPDIVCSTRVGVLGDLDVDVVKEEPTGDPDPLPHDAVGAVLAWIGCGRPVFPGGLHLLAEAGDTSTTIRCVRVASAESASSMCVSWSSEFGAWQLQVSFEPCLTRITIPSMIVPLVGSNRPMSVPGDRIVPSVTSWSMSPAFGAVARFF